MTDFASQSFLSSKEDRFPLDFARVPASILTGSGPASQIMANSSCSPTSYVGSAPVPTILPTVYESPKKERRATGSGQTAARGVNIYSRTPSGTTGATPPKDTNADGLAVMDVDGSFPSRSKPSLFNRFAKLL